MKEGLNEKNSERSRKEELWLSPFVRTVSTFNCSEQRELFDRALKKLGDDRFQGFFLMSLQTPQLLSHHSLSMFQLTSS